MATHDRLRRILETDYDLSPEKLAPDASLENLGIDSLGIMELLFKVEDEFHIKVPTFQVSLSTVQDVVDYIDELASAQSGHP
jgi:acyl carrier protein